MSCQDEDVCVPTTRKRKLERRDDDEDDAGAFPLDDLGQDVLEKVLSQLPASSFFRLGSVCKRWKSVGDSASFRVACAEVPSREPWYYMAGCGDNRAVVFDSAEMNWKSLNNAEILRDRPGSVPVASSGGLVCFRTRSGDFVVLNPVTGSFRDVKSPISEDCLLGVLPIQAIAMQSIRGNSSLFRLILVFGEIPRLHFRVLDSGTNEWGEEISLRRTSDDDASRKDANITDNDDDSDDPIYFLSKSGNEVVTNTLLRSPSKQFSSVITSTNSHDAVHFLSPSGKIIVCDLTTRTFDEYPSLLPLCAEYSIDIVECGGEPVVVLLSEFFESASLRMWKFDDAGRSWRQVAAMPPSMSHRLYGKRADVNCAGGRDGTVLMCLSSSEGCMYVAYDFRRDEWVELPGCHVDGEAREFAAAFGFEPRIEVEASVG